METTYRLNAKELSVDLVKSIQEAFKDKEIEITVTDEIDATDYLLSTEANKKHLYKSLDELESGEGIPMTLAELQEKYLK
jgi:antitoxin YefM